MTDERERFDREGCKHFPAALELVGIQRLRGLFDHCDRPGVRLDASALAAVADLLTRNGPVGKVARRFFDQPTFAVRAILFDKSADANWSLDWHQDRTIAVAAKVETDGFGPWTTKQGMLHVQPPQAVIESLITLRVHLDDVVVDNAPLRVVSGSHMLGRIAESQLESVVEGGEATICLAKAGDIWAYKTAIVHASSASSSPQTRRRVLQLDYADRKLPPPLNWAMRL